MPVEVTLALPFDAVQMPPGIVAVMVKDAPIHTVYGPASVLAANTVSTVMLWVTTVVPQLLVTAYEITALPLATPETIPSLTVTIAVSLLLHVPPVVESVKVVVPVIQTRELPAIAATVGIVLTVSMAESDGAEAPLSL
jgi:hypothetical protein